MEASVLTQYCVSIAYTFVPVVEYPSCRHTTVASAEPQESSQTVPHSLLMQISILPSLGMLPPASRMSPVEHGASHPTPASSLWAQLLVRIGLLGHCRSWLLLEKHCTSSKYIGPVPEPKKALLYGIPAAELIFNGIKISKVYAYPVTVLDIKSETGNVSMTCTWWTYT